MSGDRSRRERIAEAVLDAILSTYNITSPSDIIEWLKPPRVSPQYSLTNPADVRAAAQALRSPAGRFRFSVDMGVAGPGDVHPMVQALRAVDNGLKLGSEIVHPLETDPRDRAQKYMSVMTIRVVPSSGVALSSKAMPFHQDGLGSGGAIRFVAMCLDSGPSTGGRQLYSNALVRGLVLADRHWHRFVSATQPDALTISRDSGKQHVSVTGPLFYIDESGIPAAHFRGAGGEYTITPSASVAPWFSEYSRAISSSAQVEVLEPGDCLVVDNLSMVHSRDAFIEMDDYTRRLSRKWYAIQPNRAGVWTREPLRLHAPTYRR